MTDLSALPTPTEEAGEPVPSAASPAPNLDAVRDLVLLAHPHVVPELVRGETLDDLLASIEPASTAYTNLAARFDQPASSPPEPVPAGGTPPVPLDLERMPTSEKLRRGISQRLRAVR